MRWTFTYYSSITIYFKIRTFYIRIWRYSIRNCKIVVFCIIFYRYWTNSNWLIWLWGWIPTRTIISSSFSIIIRSCWVSTTKISNYIKISLDTYTFLSYTLIIDTKSCYFKFYNPIINMFYNFYLWKFVIIIFFYFISVFKLFHKSFI